MSTLKVKCPKCHAEVTGLYFDREFKHGKPTGRETKPLCMACHAKKTRHWQIVRKGPIL